mgnify:CR=1 FL=1
MLLEPLSAGVILHGGEAGDIAIELDRHRTELCERRLLHDGGDRDEARAQQAQRALADGSIGRVAVVLRGGEWTMVCRVAYNIALGQQRAGSVATFLSQKGVSEQRMGTLSKGAFDATGMDENGWALDRKVEVFLAD